MSLVGTSNKPQGFLSVWYHKCRLSGFVTRLLIWSASADWLALLPSCLSEVQMLIGWPCYLISYLYLWQFEERFAMEYYQVTTSFVFLFLAVLMYIVPLFNPE